MVMRCPKPQCIISILLSPVLCQVCVFWLILDFALNQPFLKGATAHGYHNAPSMAGEDHEQPRLWPSRTTYNNPGFPASLSRLLPPSLLKQPASRFLTNNRNIPLWNSMASTPEKVQQSSNSIDHGSPLQYHSPQFLHEGHLNNTTQSLNMVSPIENFDLHCFLKT